MGKEDQSADKILQLKLNPFLNKHLWLKKMVNFSQALYHRVVALTTSGAEASLA